MAVAFSEAIAEHLLVEREEKRRAEQRGRDEGGSAFAFAGRSLILLFHVLLYIRVNCLSLPLSLLFCVCVFGSNLSVFHSLLLAVSFSKERFFFSFRFDKKKK